MIEKHWFTFGLVILLCMVVGAVPIATARGNTDVPPELAKEIYETVQREMEIESLARYTLDSSLMDQVYINDVRGGRPSVSTLELVQFVKQDPTIKLADIGYLDGRKAYIEWLTGSIERREAVEQAMAAEGRSAMTDAEAASLVDETGRVAVFGRGPDPATLPPEWRYFQILSIEIDGDVAKAVVQFGTGSEEQTLIKVKDRWYEAGVRGLTFNP